MQAAANRLPSAGRRQRTDNRGAKPHFAVGNDIGLLDALPIAAAVIELTAEGTFQVTASNGRFFEMVEESSCTAIDWNAADCLQSGPIADLLQAFFDGSDVAGELDFKDGEGVSSRFLRVKLAPLPKKKGEMRCLMSIVDRTVEVQAERTLRAEMLRDSLTGLPNRLGFTDAVEKAGDAVARDLEHAVLVVDMLRFSRINESMGSLAGVHQRNADRALDLDFQFGELERRSHNLLDAFGRLEGVLDAAAKRHQHSELIAAGTGKHVAGAEREDQPPGKGDQQLIAGEAAHGLVDP